MKTRLAAMLRKRDIWPRVEAELIRLGVRTYQLEPGGKHPIIRLQVNGRERRVPVAGTSSDIHAGKNAARQIRRIVAEMRGEP